MRFCIVLNTVLVILGLTFAAPTSAHADEAVTAEMLRHISDSAVFIRTERVFQNRKFPTSGSGFFVHKDGYVLTNWHVVADQIEGSLWQKEREINAKVLKLTVVIDSGLPSEREIRAKILSRDRTRDLALLRVEYRPETYIDINQVDDVSIGENVWIAGFPFGDLLAMDRKNDDTDAPNPAVTISKGMVTSLRRDTQGKLSMVQTDAALNPGNSGGAIVNSQGHLVGVVFAGIRGGQGVGFGVSSNRVRDFLSRHAVKISFRPRMVLSPPQPIVVTVRPILIGLGSDKGQVRFEGDDIQAFSTDLRPTEAGLEGTIEFPERIAGRVQPERYTATVTLSSTLSQERIRRRYAIDAVPKSFSTLESMRDPGQMMEDRKLLANEMDISDFTKDEQVAGQAKKGSSLSDVAKSTKLRKNESGSIVVDNNIIEELGRRHHDPERYRYIKSKKLIALLQDYDDVSGDIEALKREYENSRSTYTYQTWAYRSSLNETRTNLYEERRALLKKISKQEVRYCEDKRVYFIAHGTRSQYPCQEGIRLEY